MQIVTKKRVIGDRQCQVTEMWDGDRLIGVRGVERSLNRRREGVEDESKGSCDSI